MKTQELYTRTWKKLLEMADNGIDAREREGLLMDACDYARRVFGTEHPHLYESLTKLAEFYLGIGRYITADRCYQQAFDVLVKVKIANFTAAA